MKRHLQKTGVRKFFGQDLIDLQSEPLKVLDGFFAEYGACVVTGCEITPAENDTFNVAPGVVAIPATDPETGTAAIKVMPFDGTEGVVLPLYIAANHTIVERVYGDGKVKPIAYDFHAVASGVQPETPHIVLTSSGGNRFVDVLQDDKHSFITAQERSKWNAILQAAKEYADATASTKSEATLRTSKEYTDGKDAVLRNDMTIADTNTIRAAKEYADATASTKSEATLRTSKEYTDDKDAVLRNDMAIADTNTIRAAKEYADRIVAALVDNSPEALNTLQELAKALGNDPNFATTVMQLIGEKATMTQVNQALEGKLDGQGGRVITGSTANSSYVQLKSGGSIKGIVLADSQGVILSNYATSKDLRITNDGRVTWDDKELYHSGNLGAATQGAAGLMSATDKTKLDRIANGLIAAGRASREGGFIKRFGPHANFISVTHSGNGRYVILHDLGHTEYVTTITPCERYDNTWQLGATIIAETPNYVELWITENEYTHPADFNFEITGRL